MLNQSAYTYDAEGNTLSMTDLTGRHEYFYDGLYRLRAASHPNQPQETYSYDAAGNRTSSASGQSFVYDAENRLLRTGNTQFSYDKSGNLVSRRRSASRGGLALRSRSRHAGAASYSYNALNQLVRVRDGSGNLAIYKYGPFGRRIEKNTNGVVTKYLYDFQSILQEYDSIDNLTARYTHGPRTDEPLIMEGDRDRDAAFQQHEAFFYQTDGLGSITGLADRAGNIVERYRYDSFGNLITAPDQAARPEGSLANPYFFTGREWDAEVGLYYYRARYYDPETGRFLQKDPYWRPALTTTLNRYVYVANNPVNAVDPTGYEQVISNHYAIIEDRIAFMEATIEALEDLPSFLRTNRRNLGDVALENLRKYGKGIVDQYYNLSPEDLRGDFTTEQLDLHTRHYQVEEKLINRSRSPVYFR